MSHKMPARMPEKRAHKTLVRRSILAMSLYKSSLRKFLYSHQHPVGDLNLSAAYRRVLSLRNAPPKPIPARKTSSWLLSGPVAPKAMQVSGLNHFNITASPLLIERVKRFYINIIGLKVGPRAHLDHDGYWLYAGQNPIVHLSACDTIADSAQPQKSYFNHISLSCTGLAATLDKMAATQTPYQLIEIEDFGLTQIFLKDPAGIGVELTFAKDASSVSSRPAN